MLDEAARIHLKVGRFDLAEGCLKDMRRIGRESGEIQWEAAALNRLGIVATSAGKQSEERDYLREALAICDGDPATPPLVVGIDGWLNEELRTSEEEARQELSVSNRLRERFSVDPPAALQQALALKEVEGLVHANLSKCASTAGDRVSARKHLDKALFIFWELGLSGSRAHALEDSGNLFKEVGADDEAAKAWRTAYGTLVKVGDPLAADALAKRVLARYGQRLAL